MLDKFLRYGIEVKSDPDQQKVLCPKCSHTRSKTNEACLSVSISKGVWKCWHCGWSGWVEKEKKRAYDDFPPIKPAKKQKIRTIDEWFKERGISQQTLDKAGVISTQEPVQGITQNVAAFAYYIGDKIVNYKYRTTSKQFKQTHGRSKRSVFYNINSIMFEDVAIITEGEMDALSFIEAGIDNVISVPNGAPNPGERKGKRFDYIGHSWEFIKHVKLFILAVDNDTNGRLLKDELASRLGKGKCMVVDLPVDCKDANDVLLKYGKKELAAICDQAEPYPVEGVFSLKDVKNDIFQMYDSGMPEGIKLGISDYMDNNLQIYPGQLCVVTGIPNHGKSPFVDQIAMNFAKRQGMRTAMFSPENGKVSIHSIRLVRQFTGRQFLPNYTNRMSRYELEQAMEFVNDHIYFVSPRDNAFTLDHILDNFSYLSGKYGVKMFVIDPWNTIEHHIGQESETTYIGKTLNKLKYFARDHDAVFVIVSHPTKMMRSEKTGLHYPPDMYSISGSANWYNVPDCGITIYRRYENKEMKKTKWTELYVSKVKFDFMGKVAMYKLKFDIDSQSYSEYNDNAVPVGIDEGW